MWAQPVGGIFSTESLARDDVVIGSTHATPPTKIVDKLGDVHRCPPKLAVAFFGARIVNNTRGSRQDILRYLFLSCRLGNNMSKTEFRNDYNIIYTRHTCPHQYV
jgi:hypothetical protein